MRSDVIFLPRAIFLPQFSLPELRVGTLDSLLALSDDLVKVNTLVEAVAQKIQRQVLELASADPQVSNNLTLMAALFSGRNFFMFFCCF